jgi:preprotein translocase SecE subunit
MAEAQQSGDVRISNLTRWVQVVFLVLFLFAFWVLDKLVTLGWGVFAEPSPMIASALAAAVSAGGVWTLHRHPRIKAWTDEVVAELAKVTWPSRPETSASTIVVIVASIIAAIIIGAFDAAWSAITDLIYKA